MNKFFNSVWVKCISCLLLIIMISGGLLSVISDLLYVSPEERTGRAIKKIYGEEMPYTEIYNEEKDPLIKYDCGVINTIYEISGEKSYVLFKTTGNAGYKNGTISLWVNVLVEDGKYSIDKVILNEFDKQTLMSRLTTEFYDNYKLSDVKDAYLNGKLFTPELGHGEYSNPITGATYSANAANNAVNCVINYLGVN